MHTPESNNLKKQPKNIEEYYNDLWSSDEWGSREPNMYERLRFEKIIYFIDNYVLPKSKESKPLKIIDLGCGRGSLTNLLSVYGNILGVDPVSAAIKRAKQLFPQIDFITANATVLLGIYGAKHFNLIVSSEVIEHVQDSEKEEFAKSIYTLLAPGGFALVTTPRGELWDLWKKAYPNEQPVEDWISETRLDILIRKVGFTIIARDRVFVPGYIYDWKTSIASSMIFRLLMSYYPKSGILAKLRYSCGIYQVLLLQRR
ncbi:class I SAM-dependent methyltransferase [Desulfobacterota bacterium AH_259_B03_O07]|nr:class I SAM-dependent methyltransferase [Desulfobacterota bacterium AH_259_B03_O07]